MGRERLSALILAKNEAARIEACLRRVAWADEVLVVDDLSTDDTAKIALRCGARVVRRQFDDFSSQANFGLSHVTGDWVLSLDADELVTSELQTAIERVLGEHSAYTGFTFKRLNYFLGHQMRHGGWYHDVLHLFRRGAGQFTGRVHHTPQLDGPIGRLAAAVEHYPFQNLTQFIERQNRYTTSEAQELVEEKRVVANSPKQFRGQLVWRPLKLFWKSFMKKQGFREGKYGFIFAALYAWVHFLKWAKCWELASEGMTAPGATGTVHG